MTTSQRALTKTTPRRSARTLAKAQVSQHLSHRLPYYITPEEAHQVIDAADNAGNDRQGHGARIQRDKPSAESAS